LNLRPIQFGCAVAALCLASAYAQQPLKAHVDLSRNGRKSKDASNAVIWLSPSGEAVSPPRQDPAHIPQLVQKNKTFQPPLVVIPVGGKVEFPNRDPFFHNVFSLFDGKRFDLGLYESGTTRFVQFDKAGVSFIFCNIHAQMSAVVIALATPYFGVSDARGEVSIAAVPAGRYSLQVFHSGVAAADLKALSREITVAPGETTLGSINIAESDVTDGHKNKYGRDYDRPEPDSPAYSRQ
jgi:plastocyanin